MKTNTHHLTVPGIGRVEVSVTEHGAGHPVLLLHGGGGPQTVLSWAATLAGSRNAHVITPIHPGFAGTVRPARLDSVVGLAATYVALLDALDLRDVTVVGNSIGGWVAAEMAVLATPRVTSYVLVDAVGIDVPDHPVVDFFSLDLAQVGQLSYADPGRFAVDPATLPANVRAAMPGNRAALETYAGRSMMDPTLEDRLAAVEAPTLVVWGAADRIADSEYGRVLAGAISGAQLTVMDGAGHLPQIEAPDALVELVWDFADAHATNKPGQAPA